jgi:hypothetical protein
MFKKLKHYFYKKIKKECPHMEVVYVGKNDSMLQIGTERFPFINLKDAIDFFYSYKFCCIKIVILR